MYKRTAELAVKNGRRPDSRPNIDKAGARVSWLENRIKHIYDKNPHIKLLQMEVAEAKEGTSVLRMPVRREVHSNLYGGVHGGALASLADTAMGAACISLGKQVVTQELNINYIASAGEGEMVTCAAKVRHDGKTTMVVECEMTDTAGRLLAVARGTFFVVGQFDFTED
ncbi:MAG TPA: PaaI family thioesterase [Ruminiclostridium sp.]|nr:PaaI family thioesterase [Ruminiclostridium sp.]